MCKQEEITSGEVKSEAVDVKRILQERNAIINEMDENTPGLEEGSLWDKLAPYNRKLGISGECEISTFTEDELKRYYQYEKENDERIKKEIAVFRASWPKEEQDDIPDDGTVECIPDSAQDKRRFAFKCNRCGFKWRSIFTPSRCADCGSDEIWGTNGICVNCGSHSMSWFCPECNSSKVESLAYDFGHCETFNLSEVKDLKDLY